MQSKKIKPQFGYLTSISVRHFDVVSSSLLYEFNYYPVRFN